MLTFNLKTVNVGRYDQKVLAMIMEWDKEEKTNLQAKKNLGAEKTLQDLGGPKPPNPQAINVKDQQPVTNKPSKPVEEVAEYVDEREDDEYLFQDLDDYDYEEYKKNLKYKDYGKYLEKRERVDSSITSKEIREFLQNIFGINMSVGSSGRTRLNEMISDIGVRTKKGAQTKLDYYQYKDLITSSKFISFILKHFDESKSSNVNKMYEELVYLHENFELISKRKIETIIYSLSLVDEFNDFLKTIYRSSRKIVDKNDETEMKKYSKSMRDFIDLISFRYEYFSDDLEEFMTPNKDELYVDYSNIKMSKMFIDDLIRWKDYKIRIEDEFKEREERSLKDVPQASESLKSNKEKLQEKYDNSKPFRKKYVVLSGGQTGEFDEWDKVKNIVQGKGNKGCLWKKCLTEEEVKIFKDNVEKFFIEYKQEKSESTDPLVSSDPETLSVYTDGSYDDKLERSSGAIIVCNHKAEILDKKSFIVTNEEFNTGRNVAGELAAVCEAINYAVEKKYKKIHIFHDYIGVVSWVIGAWDIKTNVSKIYIDFIKDKQEQYDLDIKFTWIEAYHDTKDERTKYNQEADRLASAALTKNKNMNANL